MDNCSTCLDGYYHVEANNKCIKCPSPCKRCLNENHCLECGYGPDLRLYIPKCECKPLYYDNTDMCKSCVSPCKECTTATECTVCLPKHFLSGTDCLPCKEGCYHCTGAEDYCEDCVDGYYLDSTLNKCNACNYPCETCYSENMCLTCGFDPHMRTRAPACFCKYGTSDNGSTCVVCTPPCKTCKSVADNDCLTCVDKYYLSGIECLDCDPECAICKNSSSECYVCEDGYYLEGT